MECSYTIVRENTAKLFPTILMPIGGATLGLLSDFQSNEDKLLNQCHEGAYMLAVF